ncbi:S8 family serine peptidase [Candidatus Microgenomates bacterium]|nr:S8 family serine peptidase [Candidatus Microgenomates bacterium]
MLKTKKIYLIWLVFFVLLSFELQPVFADQNLFDKESLLIEFSDLFSAEKILRDLPILEKEKLGSLDSYKISFFRHRGMEIEKKLRSNPNVISKEKDQTAYLSFIPNDPYYNLQDYWISSNFTKAWDINKGTDNIIVAVIDTGINYLHEDLQSRLWTDNNGRFGYDFVNLDDDPMDDHSHGTIVSGIIGASSNNNIGISGGSKVKIMAIKSMGQNGEGLISDIAQGITYAVDNGAKVINLSLGVPEDSAILDAAVSYAYNRKTLIVAANGNKGWLLPDSPARNPLAIGVGATDNTGAIASFSNYGQGTTLVAPGDSVYSTAWSSQNSNDLYQYNRGTSFATPQVTAAAALILSVDSSLSPDQLKKRLIVSAKKLSAMNNNYYSTYYGYGQLDAYRALIYDKIAPTINVSVVQDSNGLNQLTGEIIDDKDTVVMTTVPTSNISLARYQIDNGAWKTIATGTKTANVNESLATATIGQHNILVEATDTAGNKTSKQLKFNQTISLSISPSPNSYRAEIIEQSPYVNLSPGQIADMKLVFKNTGSSYWLQDKVYLGTARERDRLSGFASSSWFTPNRIKMRESLVAPGELAHFEFSLKEAPSSYGSFKEYFALVAENITWFSDIGIYWQINIATPSYHAQYIRQSPYPIIDRNSVKTFWVEYKNTGSATWTNSIVKLGTSDPQDRKSSFYTTGNSGWLGNNRVKLEQDSVAPGEIGRFTFTAKAPNTIGVYYEYFRPVADGITWMEDWGVYWKIIVL